MIDHPPTITVQHDAGGSVGEYLNRIHDAKAVHALVEIDGDCFSACTLYLGLPRDHVCITHHARLGFHKTSELMGVSFDDVLLNHYPPVIRNWLENTGGLTHNLRYLEYPELKSLFKTCEGQ